MYSYAGKILRINLSSKSIITESLNENGIKNYLGGRGLGIKILSDEVDPKADALGHDNKIIIATGPMTASGVTTGCRYSVVTKSPLNGTSTSSNSGGYWGVELKFAGYDAIILEGKADTPVYINILDDEVEILDASDIWGKMTTEITTILQKKHEKCKVLNIGPAGEKLSNMAAIMNDGDRAAGRSGVGAVMGSKKVKAITVRGTNRKLKVYDSDKLKNLLKQNLPKVKEKTEDRTKYGTIALMRTINTFGGLPVKNWQSGVYENIEDVSAEMLREKFYVRNEGCYGCVIACGRVSKSKNVTAGGPEYESAWAFGPDCDISDFNYIIDANYLCNEYGLDTISVGSTIAAAMELYEKGYIKDEELGGESLNWGSGKALVRWVELIGKREGLGNKMADGSYDFCNSYGALEYSMSVKKLEMPAYDARGFQGQGLTFATNNRGGCHIRGHVVPREIFSKSVSGIERTSTEQREVWVKEAQDNSCFNDSMGICNFLRLALGLDNVTDLYNCITGENETPESLMLKAERIFNLERIWNLKAGLSKEDDGLPKRLLEEPLDGGPSEGQVNRLYDMLPKYYRLRGWNEDGIPIPEKLKELGLVKYYNG